MGNSPKQCWTPTFRQQNPVLQVNITQKEERCRNKEKTPFFPSLSTYFPALYTSHISSHNQNVRVKGLAWPQEQYVYVHFPMDNHSSAHYSVRILSFHRIYMCQCYYFHHLYRAQYRESL